MMQWESWAAFWSMGGYGLYVWGSYGMCLLVILIEVIVLARQHKQTLHRLRRLQAWEDVPDDKLRNVRA